MRTTIGGWVRRRRRRRWKWNGAGISLLFCRRNREREKILWRGKRTRIPSFFFLSENINSLPTIGSSLSSLFSQYFFLFCTSLPSPNQIAMKSDFSSCSMHSLSSPLSPLLLLLSLSLPSLQSAGRRDICIHFSPSSFFFRKNLFFNFYAKPGSALFLINPKHFTGFFFFLSSFLPPEQQTPFLLSSVCPH